MFSSCFRELWIKGVKKRKVSPESKALTQASNYMHYTVSCCGNAEGFVRGISHLGGRWYQMTSKVSWLLLVYDSI